MQTSCRCIGTKQVCTHGICALGSWVRVGKDIFHLEKTLPAPGTAETATTTADATDAAPASASTQTSASTPRTGRESGARPPEQWTLQSESQISARRN